MTIDSRYRIQVKASDNGTTYTFEFETVREEVVEVYVFNEITGDRILVPQVTEFT
jgi:hypothetical protein